MKKVVFFLFLFGLINMSYGQLNVNPGSFPVPKTGEHFYYDNSQLNNNITRDLGDEQSVWINFPYALNSLNGFTYSLFGWPMAPDTLLNVRYIHEQSGKYEFIYDNINVCSAGSTFELYSEILQLPNFFKYTAYSVDSVIIPYIYRRYTADDVIDTIIVQLYKPNHLLGDGYYFPQDNGDKRYFAIPKYNKATNLGVMVDYTWKIPLTKDDTSLVTSTGSYFRSAGFPLPSWALPDGGKFSLTFSFKPGKAYKLGDTIPYAKWDSVQNVSNPVNLFECAIYNDKGNNSFSAETNHGLWILNWCRYKDWDTKLPGTYLPGNCWGDAAKNSYPLYPVVLFKVKYTESLSINHLANDVKAVLYPSPATTAEDINLDMTLNSKKNIRIDVYDLLGHKVSSVTNGNYNSGKHTFSISTSDLTAGMYICNIVADGAVKTLKFEVR